MRNIKYITNREFKAVSREYTFDFGSKTYIMGILNVTPDSFSDGGKFFDEDLAVMHAKEMIELGADIIDIGAESTRPGATEVSAEDEISRLTPVVKKILSEIKSPVSIDTYKSEVADKMLELGVHMINDVWGFQKDLNMAKIVAKHNVPVVIMHNQIGTNYDEDIMKTICRFLSKSIDIGLEAGIKRENIILDPGIGFGKTPEQNMEVMSRLGELNDLGYPILLGTSRKSMIGKILDLPSEERIEGTVATTTMGIVQGVDIVRVHDVKENSRAAKVTDAIVRGVKLWEK